MRSPGFLAILALAGWGTVHGPTGDDRTGDPDGPLPRAEGYRTELQRGVVLGLHSKERGYDYGPAIGEIAGLGANWVSLTFVALLDRPEGTAIDRTTNRTPSDEDLVAAARRAKVAGLRVFLFPIVLLRDPSPDDWRGNLRPADLRGWFDSYRDFLGHYADLAEREGIEMLSIGSEFCTLEKHADEWRETVASVRRRFTGLLTYSSNWDHYETPRFWDALDLVGMTAYHRLSGSRDPSLLELNESWRKIRDRVAGFSRKVGRRIVFTEVGYPSLDGANEEPWNYVMKARLDIAEQTDCYRAFATAWADEPVLQGVFFHEWWGEGGPTDKSYTPRGKPAEAVLRDYFRRLAALPPRLEPLSANGGGR